MARRERRPVFADTPRMARGTKVRITGGPHKGKRGWWVKFKYDPKNDLDGVLVRTGVPWFGPVVHVYYGYVAER